MLKKTCPHCKATYATAESCEDRFDRCLSLEFGDRAYWPVHHLTVLCYMLQHNAYNHGAWLEARQLLAQFVNHDGASNNWHRQKALDSKSRLEQQSLLAGKKFADFQRITWSFTIADVRLEEAGLYCADVKNWANHLLQDTQPFTKNRE